MRVNVAFGERAEEKPDERPFGHWRSESGEEVCVAVVVVVATIWLQMQTRPLSFNGAQHSSKTLNADDGQSDGKVE